LAVLSGAADLFSQPFDLKRDPITLGGRD